MKKKTPKSTVTKEHSDDEEIATKRSARCRTNNVKRKLINYDSEEEENDKEFISKTVYIRVNKDINHKNKINKTNNDICTVVQ